MLGLGFGINKKSTVGGFDSSYKAILNYAVNNGITLPSEERQEIENQFVITLKDIGLWNRLDVLYMFKNAPNEEYSMINWKNPSINYITKVNSPTWNTATGWTTISASSSYLNTNYTPNTHAVNCATQSLSIGAYVSAGSGHVTANTAGTLRYLVSTTFNYARLFSLDTASSSTTNTYPLHVMVNRSVNSLNFYKQGVSYNTGTNTNQSLPSVSTLLGYFSGPGDVTMSYFFMGSSIADIPLDIYNAFDAYIS